MQKTAIIIPCYNEGRRLRGREFVEAAARDENLHFVFVNDGSTDDTEEKIVGICGRNPAQCHRVTLEKNGGKAEAVRRGFMEAFRDDFTVIGYWDADLATPLGAIDEFCRILDKPDVSMVIGSRVRLLGRKIKRRAARHYLGRIFATTASLVLGLPVYDTQCGAKVFRRRKELEMVFARPFTAKWIFDVEILARFLVLERCAGTASLVSSCVEHPLEEWTDVAGSKLKPVDFFLGLLELMRIFFFLHAPGAGRRFLDRSAGSTPDRRTP